MVAVDVDVGGEERIVGVGEFAVEEGVEVRLEIHRLGPTDLPLLASRCLASWLWYRENAT